MNEMTLHHSNEAVLWFSSHLAFIVAGLFIVCLPENGDTAISLGPKVQIVQGTDGFWEPGGGSRLNLW